MSQDQQTITQTEFARIVGISKRTAIRWASLEKGPKPARIGGQGAGSHTLYVRAEVDAWTAELARQGRRAKWDQSRRVA